MPDIQESLQEGTCPVCGAGVEVVHLSGIEYQIKTYELLFGGDTPTTVWPEPLGENGEIELILSCQCAKCGTHHSMQEDIRVLENMLKNG